jgi:hypothetical protein
MISKFTVEAGCQCKEIEMLSLEKCHRMKMEFHWGMVLSVKGMVSQGNVNEVT